MLHMRWVGYAYKIMAGKFDGKRKPRCTWEDNIKMNGKEKKI